MKRIEFIAPVEAMRGNLSGTQKNLVYPTDDNRAYESPVGSRNYARNYQPIFVGAKRASDNLKYFAVRTKTAIGMTSLAKLTMAVLGGCGAIIAAILRDKTATLYTDTMAAYEYAKSRGGEHTKSFREYLTWQIKGNLRAKAPACFFGMKDNLTSVIINNPWHSTGYNPSALSVNVTEATLVKFWTQLADFAITFYVGSRMGVAHVADTFETLSRKPYNNLNISIDGEHMARIGNMYLVYPQGSTNYQVMNLDSVDVAENNQYTLQENPGETQG